MKHNTVILVMLMALAGCSATYTGDSKSFNKSDSANHGRFIVSKEGAATSKQSTQWDDLFVVYWSTRSWLF